MTSKVQQIELDNALVTLENRRVIGKCNMRINPGMKPKEPTYQVALDALAITTCYPAFLLTAEVPVIYMHQFWATIAKHKASYRFKIDHKRFFVNVEVFREILNICPKVRGKAFDEPPTEEEALSFIRELGHIGEIKLITSSKKQDKLFYPRITSNISSVLAKKDKSISMRNRMFMHTARDDSLLGTMRFVSRHADTQVYGAILPQAITNQALLDLVAYKTYYAIALGAEPPISMKSQKKSDSTITSKESPSKKKSAKSKKVAATKPKPTKKKTSVKADRGKDLNVLSEVALSKADQLKEAIEQSKKDSFVSQASGLGDGTDLGSGIPDEQHRKTSGTDEGTGIKPGVPDVPKYDSESEKESWGNSEEEDDDEDDSVNESDDDNNDDDDGDNDADDDDNQEEHAQEEEEEYVYERVPTPSDYELIDNNKNDDEEETDSDRTESDIIKTPIFDQSTTEYHEKEDEKVDDEEKIDDEEDDEVTKELYGDVNVNLGNRDDDMTDADQGGPDQQNVFKIQGLSNKLLNLENPSPADNEIASLMDTTVRHEEPGNQVSSPYTVLVTTVPELTSMFITPLFLTYSSGS
ncbi:hypothetical protein Tco_1127014 [Tanacetum coccineum]